MSFPVSLVLVVLRFLEKIGHRTPEKKEHVYTDNACTVVHQVLMMGGTMKLACMVIKLNGE
jgi:hypothetical protein